MLLSIIKGVLPEVLGWSESARKRKEIKLASQLEQTKLKGELEVTKIQSEIDLTKAKTTAEIKMRAEQNASDSDYDMQVLKNRDNSIIDELIIVCWFIIFLGGFAWALFAPETAADRLGQAFAAFDKALWWFEFGMVGILVSTLGLMRLFRMWAEGIQSKFKPQTGGQK